MEQDSTSDFAPYGFSIACLSGFLVYLAIRFLTYTMLKHEGTDQQLADLKDKLELALSCQEDTLQDLRILEERNHKSSEQEDILRKGIAMALSTLLKKDDYTLRDIHSYYTKFLESDDTGKEE